MSEENKQEIIENKEDNKKDLDNINSLKTQLEEQKKILEEKEDRLKRIMAEFDNFKKRSTKERDSLYSSLISDIVLSLLPVLDNLEKAVSTETKDESFKQGIEMVLKQFLDTLNLLGVKPIQAVGNPFDPELHEAVQMIQDETLGEKIIKEEYRKGYMIGNKVIRHSMVIVAN